MKIDDLKRHQSFYTNSAYMGVDAIFRRHFSLEADFPVPLSVAHGVDFGHTFYPQDVKSHEPIHWAPNDKVYREARAYKPALLIPHPWALLAKDSDIPEGSGTLVIGPPPGPVNDARLFTLIETMLGPDSAILVKARGATEGSIAFWRDRDIAPVTAGIPDQDFYHRLMALIGGYKRVIGVTFSSALIYAAAIGKHVQVVPGFRHRTLEGMKYEEEVNWGSTAAAEVVRTFVAGDNAATIRLSRALLGCDLGLSRDEILATLHSEMEKLRSPFWGNPEVRFPPRAARKAIATLTGKPGLLNAGASSYVARLRRRELAIMTVDEIDIWLNGKSPENWQLTPVVRTGVAGHAAEGYAR